MLKQEDGQPHVWGRHDSTASTGRGNEGRPTARALGHGEAPECTCRICICAKHTHQEEQDGKEDGDKAKGPRDVVNVSWAMGNFFSLISFYFIY